MHLAWHVPRCAHDRSALGCSVVHDSNDAEIAQLDLSFLGDIDVCALDVAVDDSYIMYAFHRNSQLTCNRYDEVFFKWWRRVGAHERANTAACAVVADDPELRVQVKGIMDQVDVAGSTVFELLKDSDFLSEILDGFITLQRISAEIHVIDVNDLHGNHRRFLVQATISISKR